MSFITKIGQDSGSNQKLVLMKKRYFRNILQFNQVTQHQKKEQQHKTKQQSHRQFNKIVDKQMQILDREKMRMWNRKVNNQTILKDDYEKQMVERVEGERKDKYRDRLFSQLQEIENDRFMERRMVDFMKIYDRKAVKSTLHRRIKTQGEEEINPEMRSYGEERQKQFMIPDRKYHFSGMNTLETKEQTLRKNEELQNLKRQLQQQRQQPLYLPPLTKEKPQPQYPSIKSNSHSLKTLVPHRNLF